MKLEVQYFAENLTDGRCSSCGEQSNEILIGDGRCIDCIEEQRFYEETMKGV